VKLAKNLRKKTALVILLVIVASLGAFFAGGLAHKYSIHQKILGVGGASYVVDLIRKSVESPFFYPAPKQELSEIFQKRDVKYPFTFIVYGDSREPAGYEKEALIKQIIKENPSFVLHVGDLVLYGEEHQWKIFDLFEGRIIDSGIPIYPVLGNHEYHTRKEPYPTNPQRQLQHYFDRFKFLKNKRWYSFTYGNSRFLILDTNTDYSPGSNQYDWFIKELSGEDPGFLFIAFHHPPYTKSGRLRESERMLANILESYNKRGLIKTDIVFSGHVHNYERYKHNGINYIVTGGGGAPPHFINRDRDDFFTEPGATFHYCKIEVSETEATFKMIRLNEDTKEWVISDTFTIYR
jgi:predicted phosphodiesterase